MKKRILDIASFLFDDSDFNIIETHLRNKEYKELSAFIAESKELTNILLTFDNDNVELKDTLDKLDELEREFIDLYLGVELINE